MEANTILETEQQLEENQRQASNNANPWIEMLQNEKISSCLKTDQLDVIQHQAATLMTEQEAKDLQTNPKVRKTPTEVVFDRLFRPLERLMALGHGGIAQLMNTRGHAQHELVIRCIFDDDPKEKHIFDKDIPDCSVCHFSQCKLISYL